jgi:hypothetical protein
MGYKYPVTIRKKKKVRGEKDTREGYTSPGEQKTQGGSLTFGNPQLRQSNYSGENTR